MSESVAQQSNKKAAPERRITSQREPLWRLFSPLAMIQVLVTRRDLALQLVGREIRTRYRGSFLGIVWSLITPLAMLSVYTFVFGKLFHARWGQSASSSIGEFALTMFCGLIAYNILAESMNAAPTLFLRNPNYVKKVVFPLEIVPVSVVGASLVTASMGFAVLTAGMIAMRLPPDWTLVLLPLCLVPICMCAIGVSWFLATLGMFVRDLASSMPIVTQLLIFATPIFYPQSLVERSISAKSSWWAKDLGLIITYNPLTNMVTNVRRVVLWHKMPVWPQMLLQFAFALVVMVIGYAAYRRGRGAFADVL